MSVPMSCRSVTFIGLLILYIVVWIYVFIIYAIDVRLATIAHV